MPIRVYYEVLNQKGTPALYSDNYASRPAAGYQGRIFYSPDTAQIFYDTGSTWTLLADAGVGSGSLASVTANGNTTATGIVITANGLSTNSLTSTNLTAGSVPFIGTGGLFSEDNTNLFWDNTNKRLGINTNSPSVSLDIHGTTGVLVQVNNTGAADSKIAFLQASSAKWRIGNLYNAGANSFHIYNNSTATTPLVITNNDTFFFNGTSQYVFAGPILANLSIAYKENVGTTTSSGYTTFNAFSSGATNTLTIVYGTSNQGNLIFNNAANYSYTFPSATGTLALTSNLSSYLPLAGGTLTGGLTINSTLYINPTNTGLTGLDVASNNTSFRSDNLEGSKRQLLLNMGSGTLIQFSAQGYGAARTTDLAFYSSNSGGLNSTPAIYITGGNNVGFGTGIPSVKVEISSSSEVLRLRTSNSSNYFTFFNSSGVQSGNIGFDERSTNVLSIWNNISTGTLLFGAGGSSRMTINENGNVTINAPSTASTALTVNGYNNGWTSVFNGASANSYGIQINAGTNDGDRAFQVRDYSLSLQNMFAISGTGNIGVGVQPAAGTRFFIRGGTSGTGGQGLLVQNSSATNLFYVRDDGAFYSGVLSSFTTGSAANMYVDPGNGFLYRSTSSLKYKTDVLDYDKGLDVIKQMRPVYYKGINDGDKQFAGFIAEEVNGLGLNEFVQYADDNTPDALYYSNMTALLTKGIQQLDTRLTNVEDALLKLQQQLN